MELLDYAFYRNEYDGSFVVEPSFYSALKKASIVFNKLTFGSVVFDDESEKHGMMIRGMFVPFNGKQIEELRFAMCNLIDTMYSFDNHKKVALSGNSSANVKSKSSGGESITYESKTTAYDLALQSETAKMMLYKDALMEYINIDDFEVNPFYAGVR